MEAIIMAGGKGTRIRSIAADMPKPMLPVGGKPILLHQIENLKKAGIIDIIITIGHLGSVIKDYFGNGEKFGVNISYVEETFPLGTAGALSLIKDDVSDTFVFLFGDLYLNVDFNRMLNFHKTKNADATLFVHPNLHPYDSVLVDYDDNKQITTIDSNRMARSYDYDNEVNAGLFVFSKRVFKYVPIEKKTDLENEVIIPMINDGLNVYAYKSTEYVKDMGTPERYESVNSDFDNGICEQRNLNNKQKCIFLDRDGTINEYIGYLVNKDQIKLLDGVAEAIKKINSSEYLCIIVTNQPVIARGQCTFEELKNIHKRLQTLLGNEGSYVDDIYFCPHHQDKGFEGEIEELKFDCDCRKPKIGMITRAVLEHNIDVDNSIIIGDSTLDIMLGKNAGLKSVLVHTGLAGSDLKYVVNPDMEAEDLEDAIDSILNIRKR